MHHEPDHERHHPKIMIVDDTPENLELLEEMLFRKGYEVAAFPDGEMALKALDMVAPDLILLDILMPGMDGYALCGRIKENPATADVPILFVSALNRTEDIVRAFAAGAADYVTKPF